MPFSRQRILFFSFLCASSHAQLSRVLTRGGSDVRTFANLLLDRNDTDWATWQALNTAWNSLSILRSDSDFEGTVFMPVNSAFEKIADTEVYQRVFNDQAYESHLEEVLFHHMVPGESKLRLFQLVDETSNLQLETVIGETLDANTVASTIVQSNINSNTVMGHKVSDVLLPSFWDTSASDVVYHPSLTKAGESFTVYLPPIVELADCTSFWDAHIVAGEVIMEPSVTVLETVYVNNGVVHRIAQPLAYEACPTEAPTSTPTSAPTSIPTGDPTRSPTLKPTSSPIQSSPTTMDGPTTTIVVASPSTESPSVSLNNSNDSTTDSPTSSPTATPALFPSSLTSVSQETDNNDRNYLPLIAGISVASCLISMGCVLGYVLSRHNSKKRPQAPPKQTSGLPSNFFDAPTVIGNPEPAGGDGVTLDPSIQEPSLLTLPTFLGMDVGADTNDPDNARYQQYTR